MIYGLIAYGVGIAVGILIGFHIGRRRGIDDAVKAARKEIATMQGERLQRSDKRLQASLDRIGQKSK